MPNSYRDLSGQKFGRWLVLHRDVAPERKRPVHYVIQCECGTIQSSPAINITRGHSTQCMKCAAKRFAKPLIGKTFRNLTIIDCVDGEKTIVVKVRCKYGHESVMRTIYAKRGFCPECGPLGGKKIHMLTVLKKAGAHHYECLCDCGKTIIIDSLKLQTKYPSCGCRRASKGARTSYENAQRIIGTKIGKLMVTKFKGFDTTKRAVYELECECGNIIEKKVKHLYGQQSCGCIRKESAARGSRNYNSILTENDVGALRELFSTGCYSRKKLAEIFSLNYEHVCSLIKGIGWEHVK
jgi:hypothetical protein